MKILFTFVGGFGHFQPLVPIAHAARTAGHTVAFGCAPSMAEAVGTAGFTVLALGAAADGAPTRIPLQPVDRAREERDLRERFVERAAHDRAPRTLALCAQWRPDVLVCDETDFGSLVAAERLGLPYATVLVIAAGGFVRPDVVGAALDELRAAHGLPPDPTLERLRRYLVLAPFPPRYRDPADPLPATAHAIGPPPCGASETPPPTWATVLPGAPAIYLTLGTVFNLESGDLLARALAGLREIPANLLVTTGSGIDRSEFGEQPRNVRIERHVPQIDVLPHCDLVVSHGGSGSVIGALAHGVPQVLIPIGADQPLNAARCVALGVGRALDARAATPDDIRVAATNVLADAHHRRNAEELRDEIAALPSPAHAVGLLERLVAEKAPLRQTIDRG